MKLFLQSTAPSWKVAKPLHQTKSVAELAMIPGNNYLRCEQKASIPKGSTAASLWCKASVTFQDGAGNYKIASCHYKYHLNQPPPLPPDVVGGTGVGAIVGAWVGGFAVIGGFVTPPPLVGIGPGTRNRKVYSHISLIQTSRFCLVNIPKHTHSSRRIWCFVALTETLNTRWAT